jgi:sucrose phosphorylase
VARTGDGREINRHNFTSEEIRAAAEREVVKRLDRLVRLRNSHPAFDGSFQVLPSSDGILLLARNAGEQSCVLEVDFRSMRSTVTLTDARARLSTLDL